MAAQSGRAGAFQVFVRIVAVLTGGVGIAVCLYSLTLQFDDVQGTFASICWFAGLMNLVVSIAAYASTYRREVGRVALYVILVIIVACITIVLLVAFLDLSTILVAAVILFVLQIVLLIICRLYLRSKNFDLPE